jgi:twitching motility protein PilT
MKILEYLSETVRLNSTDLHIICGNPPMLRLAKKLTPLPNVGKVTADEARDLIFSTMTESNKTQFLENKELDYSISIPSARFRVNAYYQRATISAAFRLIPEKVPSPDFLRLPGICYEFAKLKQGLVLVTGPTGHGKSTTCASMINLINTTRAEHIITIEDPIEYIFPIGLGIVSQREMRSDSLSWKTALKSVLREDPNVVYIGEMRDYDTMQSVITIAETGHLVFATLHTNSAAQTIDRIIDVFPEHQQNQVRTQLAFVLEGILSQRLIPSIQGGVAPVFEIMTATPAVRSTIREAKTHLMDNIIQTSRAEGMVPLEVTLAQAVKEGTIAIDVAMSYALRPHELAKMLG